MIFTGYVQRLALRGVRSGHQGAVLTPWTSRLGKSQNYPVIVDG